MKKYKKLKNKFILKNPVSKCVLVIGLIISVSCFSQEKKDKRKKKYRREKLQGIIIGWLKGVRDAVS